MNKSKRIFLLLFIFFIVSACNHNQEPKITITAQVLEISDEEFRHPVTYGLENISKDDFRKFRFRINMEHLDKLTSQKIHAPQRNIWKDAIGDRFWYSTMGYATDDEVDAEYFSEFIFYSRGLSEKELKHAFNSTKITVSWVSDEGETIKKEYTIGNYVKFYENNES